MRETVRVRENAANSALEEDATNIRAGVESKKAGRKREGTEARDWDEYEIRVEAERKREEVGANTKTDNEAAQRARAWS